MSIVITETDHSTKIGPETKGEVFGMIFSPSGPARRVPKIVKINKQWYTKESIAKDSALNQIPRKFRFNSKRLAKIFFTNTVTLKSQKQLIAVFGKTSQAPRRIKGGETT